MEVTNIEKAGSMESFVNLLLIPLGGLIDPRLHGYIALAGASKCGVP